MRRIGHEELQKIMFDLLKRFDVFCRENGITYFLDSGTLIGAVRHHGFIPWDDDIDVCMLRPDYNRFLQFCADGKLPEFMTLIKPEDTLFPYAKVGDTRTLLIEYPETLRTEMNVYIDIFPKDGVPNDFRKAHRLCRKVEFYNNLYWFNKYSVRVWKHKGNLIKKLIAILASPFVKDSRYPLRKALKLATKYDYEKADHVATIVAGGMHNCVPKDCFASKIEMDFNGYPLPVMVGYDQYLRTLYSHINNGDYMQLPPEDKKILHETEVYWKDGFEETQL